MTLGVINIGGFLFLFAFEFFIYLYYIKIYKSKAMSKLTKVFTLPSGVECEVTELTGKHQRLLTQDSGKRFEEKLNDLLLDVIVRIGDRREINEALLQDLLSADRKAILVETRMFSLGDDGKTFSFKWKYLDKENQEQEVEKVADLSNGFPVKKYPFECATYDEVKTNKVIEFELPRSKDKCRITLLDGKGENIGSLVKKKDRSSHTPLIMRNPQILREEQGKAPLWLQADLDSMSLVDIEAIRKKIKESEGQVDTEMMFEHPEAEYKSGAEKNVIVDLLGEMAFFFPSEAI